MVAALAADLLHNNSDKNRVSQDMNHLVESNVHSLRERSTVYLDKLPFSIAPSNLDKCGQDKVQTMMSTVLNMSNTHTMLTASQNSMVPRMSNAAGKNV